MCAGPCVCMCVLVFCGPNFEFKHFQDILASGYFSDTRRPDLNFKDIAASGVVCQRCSGFSWSLTSGGELSPGSFCSCEVAIYDCESHYAQRKQDQARENTTLECVHRRGHTAPTGNYEKPEKYI